MPQRQLFSPRALLSSVVLAAAVVLFASLGKWSSERVCVGFSDQSGGCTRRLAMLHDAAFKGNVVLVQWLLRLGWDVNGGNEYEVPPVLWAVRGAHPQVVGLLLDEGASLSIRERKVSGGLGWGTEHSFNVLCGHPATGVHGTPPDPEALIAVAELLLAAGADANHLNGGASPLSYCIATGRIGLARYLIARGVDLNKASRYASGPGTPLYEATKRDDAQLRNELLKRGARCAEADEEKARLYGIKAYLALCASPGPLPSN